MSQTQPGRQQPAPGVNRADIVGWIVKDTQRLQRLLAQKAAGADVLPEEIAMVEATIAQLEAELAYLDAVERRNSPTN